LSDAVRGHHTGTLLIIVDLRVFFKN